MICIFIHWELESPHFGSLLKIGGLDIIFLGMSTYLFSIYLYEEIDSALGCDLVTLVNCTGIAA